MDRFNAMLVFVRVVEAGNFTKAAEALQMSKASVTLVVQQLEARLRVKLLNRTTRRVNVTPDGVAYYESSLKILAELDDAESSLSNATVLPRGRLRVDVPSPLARMIIIPALPGFYAQYPDIQIIMGASDRMVDLIGESVDCVIRGGELTNTSLIARRVGDLKLGVYAAPSYLENTGLPAHPQDLSTPPHHIVSFKWTRSGSASLFAMQRNGERFNVQGRYMLSVDDGNACLAAGLAGLGVLWLPEYMAAEHVSDGKLIILFDDWQLNPIPMYVAFPPNRHVSAKLRVFIDWVVDLMSRNTSTARHSN